MKTYEEAKKEILTVDLAEDLVDIGMDMFWQTVGDDLFAQRVIFKRAFEKACGEEPTKEDMDEWYNNVTAEIDKLMKQQLG